MWNLGRKKKTPEVSESVFPPEKEFWLMCGEFRDGYTDRSKRGYYAFAAVLQSLFTRQEKSPVRTGFTNLSIA